ncbi:concanavalin A-like lectin/glucanase, partial [Metschnikowia bicuspidata]
SSSQDNFLTYTIECTPDFVKWSVDGQETRTMYGDGIASFAHSPMKIKIGLSTGGDPLKEPDYIEWAGGETHYSKLLYNLHIGGIKVAEYSTGTNYEYTDKSGSWESIKAIDGEVLGRIQDTQDKFDTL